MKVAVAGAYAAAGGGVYKFLYSPTGNVSRPCGRSAPISYPLVRGLTSISRETPPERELKMPTGKGTDSTADVGDVAWVVLDDEDDIDDDIGSDDGDVLDVVEDVGDVPYLHYPGDVVAVVEDTVEDAGADITEDYVWDVLADIVLDLIVLVRENPSDPDPGQVASALKEAVAYSLRRGVAPSAQELVIARAHIRRRLGSGRRDR
jgi:hypothetical protein